MYCAVDFKEYVCLQLHPNPKQHCSTDYDRMQLAWFLVDSVLVVIL